MTKVMIALAMLMCGVVTLGMTQQAVASDSVELYERGLDQLYGSNGAEQNPQEAVRCLTELAERGWAIAQFKLGEIYHQGIGVAGDRVEAFKWYSQAARQHYLPAEERLAELRKEMDSRERRDAARVAVLDTRI
ncbi:MAG TPA: sel1 repeat family protein [Thioalkalivibrio sp.]|nr:sel1 repeat family protein [Thioalkalivibrio sp.]